jgi:hypothetical protein
MGMRGKIALEGIVVPELAVGPLNFPNILVCFGTDKSRTDVPCLGIDVLSRCDVLIDYPAKKLYLQPTSHLWNASFLANQSLFGNPHPGIRDLNVRRNKQNEWVIVSFKNKSPFTQAGVKVGDILESISGRPVLQNYPDVWTVSLIKKDDYLLTILRGPTRKKMQIRVVFPPQKTK